MKPIYDHVFNVRHEVGYARRVSGRVRLHVYVDETASTAQYLTRWEAVKFALRLLWLAGCR